MTEPPRLEIIEKKWWHSIVKPIADSFKNECNLQAYELGMEACLGTYLITAFALKRPQSAFKYSMISFFLVPLVYWPFCAAKRKADLTPKEL